MNKKSAIHTLIKFACCNSDYLWCDDCPMYIKIPEGKECRSCTDEEVAEAVEFLNKEERASNNLYLDLINRQKAEIERLKYLLDYEEKKYDLCAKRFFKEGVKEFAERLPELIPNFSGETTMECVETAVQHLKNEMVGENND